MTKKEILYLIIAFLLGLIFFSFILKEPPLYFNKDEEIMQQEVPPSPKPEEPKKTEPNWFVYKPIRNVTNLGRVLSDIESHMPTNHIYKDNDKITWAHETTHGINSNLRKLQENNGVSPVSLNSANIAYVPVPYLFNPTNYDPNNTITRKMVYKALNGINVFYVLENKSCIIKEPNITLDDIAKSVPISLRGDVYQLYMITQQRDWNDCPLYVLDEWDAYTNGADCRIDNNISSRQETVKFMLEFQVYSTSMMMYLSKRNYFDPQLENFVKFMSDRTMNVYDQSGIKCDYIEKIKNSPDAGEFRNFCKSFYGNLWLLSR